jgi:GNAT superfamily N-acetyltransferase
MVKLITVAEPEDVECARTLFREYAARQHFIECFQDFGRELAELPGQYGPPAGRLLLARLEGEPAGCVGLRKIGEGVCEMKRLYVRPAFRGRGIGRKLVDQIIAEARTLGYARMRLDTLEEMREAQAMYEQLGFRRIEPYRQYPISEVLFMELLL